ncbi:MAG: IS630 family transposase [Chloroflexi bacterium]|nr:IS630 family transposase [Chloroflexota bacterium]
MSRPLVINWRAGDTEESLIDRYKSEKDTSIRTRLHALALLRQGFAVAKVVHILRVTERSVRRWISWYRNGGIEEIRAHRQGIGGGRPCLLDARQQGTLLAKVASGFFVTAGEIREWITERFSVDYAQQSVYGLLKRLGGVSKIPRPRHEKADVEAQKHWKAEGLREALVESGMLSGDPLFFSDEARVGLYGSNRRVWGVRGIKVIQLTQIRRQWKYLFAAVNPITGALYWNWIDSMSKENTVEALSKIRERSDIRTLVWDGAGSHRSHDVRSIEGIDSITQPPFSPELNPVERLFQEVRRWTDGRVYESIEEKMSVADDFLRGLASDPKRVQSLCGFEWIKKAVRDLPT